MNNREKLALLKLLDQINDKLYKLSGEQLDDEILAFRAVLMQEGNPEPLNHYRAITDPEGPIYKKAQEMLSNTTIPNKKTQDPLGRTHEECDDCLKQRADPPKCKGHLDGPSRCMEFDSKYCRCDLCGERHAPTKRCENL